MSYEDEPEYITWQLFQGEENQGGMKTGLGDQARKGEVETQRSAF